MPTAERPTSAHFADPAPDADQAGFARILEMLQTRGNNPTPQNQETTKPRTPLYARATEPKPDPEARPSSSSLISLLTGQNPPQQQEPVSSYVLPPQDQIADSRSPVDLPTHTRQQSGINKDEVLLNLLRQASLAPKPQPSNPHHQQLGGVYGMPADLNVRAAARNQMIPPVQGQDLPVMPQRRETGRSMYDEAPISMYQNEPGAA